MLLALRPGYRSAMRFSDVTTLTGNIARRPHHFYCIYCIFKMRNMAKALAVSCTHTPAQVCRLYQTIVQTNDHPALL